MWHRVQQVIQICQSPFSGDSCSDSSDVDEPNGVLPSMSRNKAVNSRHPAAKCKSATDRSTSQEGSCSSLASETSSDYAFPPEDGASLRTDSSDVCLEAAADKSAATGSFGSYKKVSFQCICVAITFIGPTAKL